MFSKLLTTKILILLFISFLLPLAQIKETHAADTFINGTIYEGGNPISASDCSNAGLTGDYYRASADEIKAALQAAATTGAFTGLFSLFMGAPVEAPLDTLCKTGGKISLKVVKDSGIAAMGIQVFSGNANNRKVVKTSKLKIVTVESGKVTPEDVKFELRSDPDSKLLNKEFDLAKKEFSSFSDFLDNPIGFVQDKVETAFDQALKSAIVTLINWVNITVEYLAGWINASLTSDALFSNDNNDKGGLQKSWIAIRDIALTILALAVIIIAFANVLSINIEQFGVQRMIPKLVVAIILTYFSFFIGQFLLDLANTLQAQLWNIVSTTTMPTTGEKTVVKQFMIETTGYDVLADLSTFLFLIILLVFVALALAYLSVILLARIVILNFLIVIAPVAFILSIMPFTESLYKRWWSEFAKWVFLGPAVMFMLAVGSIILMNVESSVGPPPSGIDASPWTGLFGVATAAVAYFLAAEIPKQMTGMLPGAGSAALKGLKGMGKRVPGVKYTQEWAGQRSKMRESARAQKVAGRRAELSEGNVISRWRAGVTKDQAREMQGAFIADEQKKAKEIVDMNEMAEMFKHGNNFAKRAVMREVSDRGPGAIKSLARELGDETKAAELANSFSKMDSQVYKSVIDKSPMYALQSRGADGESDHLAKAALGKLENKAIEKIDGETIMELHKLGKLAPYLTNEENIERTFTQGDPSARPVLDSLQGQGYAALDAYFANPNAKGKPVASPPPPAGAPGGTGGGTTPVRGRTRGKRTSVGGRGGRAKFDD